MITFKCDKCGSEEFTVHYEEVEVFDEIVDFYAYFQCFSCEEKEQLSVSR